jgi:uncharacterized protein (TIGR02453 family)
MSSDIDLKPVLEFLSELRDNNERAWFESNRAAYRAAKEQFEAFVDLLIGELGAFEDLAGVSAADCVFRIHRDVRFSKDKSPYKTHVAAAIASGGKKSSRLAYYIHIEPNDESLIAGGLHMPPAEQIARFREAIGRDAGPFKAIVGNEEYRGFYGPIDGEKLKTAPQGYPRDHPEIELLRLKEVVAVHHMTDETVLSPDFAAHVVDAFIALKPFLDYLNAIVQ